MTITFRPAAERLEAYRAIHDSIKQGFYEIETPKLEKLTKAQLMGTGDVAIHESYPKAELVEDALTHRWAGTDVAKEYQRVLHLESRESEVVDAVEEIQKRYRQVLDTIAVLANVAGDLPSLDGAVKMAKQTKVMVDLWTRVAEVTGPNRREPLDAIRFVANEATQQALDALEDNTPDLLAARVIARWIRRNEHLIKALETYK